MRRLLYAAGAAAVLGAAAYVYVYLSRWEWQRALFTAALLLIAEVALVGGLILDRIAGLEARLPASGRGQAGRVPEPLPVREPLAAGEPVQGSQPPLPAGEPVPAGEPMAVGAERVDAAGEKPDGSTLDHLRATAPPQRVTFRWLRPDGPAVFVPVLLGAGIAVSGLAWVVERVARFSARPVMERGLAGRLEPLTLPAGGPLGSRADVPDPSPRRPIRIGTVIAVALTAAAMTAAGFWIAEHTQDRPDAPSDALVTTLVIEADGAGRVGDLDAKVTERWELCRETSRLRVTSSGMVPLDGDRFAIVVQPGLGENATKRLLGCLQDTTVDYAQISVVSVTDARGAERDDPSAAR
jgi:hypothetical protein